MKTVILLATIALALPLASAALPVACADACTIDAASTGYTPPLAIVASGATVTFASIDITHVTTDQTVGSAQHCFAIIAERSQSASVRFDVADGALTATVDGQTLACGSAVGDAAGGYALPYFCAIHPTMRGVLVVTG